MATYYNNNIIRYFINRFFCTNFGCLRNMFTLEGFTIILFNDSTVNEQFSQPELGHI